jgi:hypothetical protein
MSRWFLVRNVYAQRSGEIWSSSPVYDDLATLIELCIENYHGNFLILPRNLMPSIRARFKVDDWNEHFGEGPSFKRD